mmetsp:Transcript_17002/g.31858  ORF Transcript_17002/g.31858 Transcript_17002/m.31858 type:complete len:97 (-) Transcript_17002:1348-1638(-)
MPIELQSHQKKQLHSMISGISHEAKACLLTCCANDQNVAAILWRTKHPSVGTDLRTAIFVFTLANIVPEYQDLFYRVNDQDSRSMPWCTVKPSIFP